jgi:16S rRNA (adenine1518-N6/adenine1519-N6)-dimethyltransferase
MEKLTSPGFVSRLLARHQIRLQKKWGQNFLVDENIIRKIVDTAGIGQEDTVLEIGPGIGTLTVALARRAKKVLAVEIDGRLIAVLKETLAEYPNVEIINADALELDYRQLLAGKEPVRLVANLPFNVATPLLYRWLKDSTPPFCGLVCMVQKEVAQRITAAPGGRDYGGLSVVCRYAAEARLAFRVPGTVFFPRPEVAGAVVAMLPRCNRSLDPVLEPLFFKVVEAAFAQRRKTLKNTLENSFPLLKGELAAVAGSTGINLSRRGETLNVTEFAKLTRVIYNILDST